MMPSAVAKLRVEACSTLPSSGAPALLGEPEVEDLHLPAQVEHQVLGLEVAVDHAGRVRVAQRVGDVPGDPQGLAQLERAALGVEDGAQACGPRRTPWR